MTVKNFLKTAILGISLCSVFIMNNNTIASNDISSDYSDNVYSNNDDIMKLNSDTLENIQKKLHYRYVEGMTKSHFFSDEYINRENQIERKAYEIIKIICNTIHNNYINDEQYNTLRNNIHFIQNIQLKSKHDSSYRYFILMIQQDADKILNKVSEKLQK